MPTAHGESANVVQHSASTCGTCRAFVEPIESDSAQCLGTAHVIFSSQLGRAVPCGFSGWDAATPVVGRPADSVSPLPEPPTTKAAEPSSYMSIWTQLALGRAVSDMGGSKAVLRFLLLFSAVLWSAFLYCEYVHMCGLRATIMPWLFYL